MLKERGFQTADKLPKDELVSTFTVPTVMNWLYTPTDCKALTLSAF